jgi:hypothetical protein
MSTEKNFKTPNDLLVAFEKYKVWAKKHPWLKKEAIKSGPQTGQLINIPHERPLTMWGFATFLKMSAEGVRNYGRLESYKEYFSIYNRILDEMTEQRVSGALTGVYNGNLVARIDGLVEHQSVNHSGLPEPPSELRVVIERDE